MSNADPSFAISRMTMSLWVPAAVHAAAELGLADALCRGPADAASLARALGTDPDATARLLAALVVLDVVRPEGHAYALTEVGRCLVSDSAQSMRAVTRLMGGRGVWDAWGSLAECVRTGRAARALRAESASGAEHFDELASDPEQADVFHRAMVEWTRRVAPAIVRAIDLRDARTIVDVGGGYGELLCAALEAAPGARGVVHDLASAREGALRWLEQRGVAQRASFVVGSFFDEAPPAGDVLLVKSVIHDWDDARSIAILRRCRDALRAGDRLMLIEPPAAPAAGLEWVLAFSDLNMLVNTGGRERSEAQYVALLRDAGLRVRAVRETGTLFKVLECVREEEA